MPTSQSRELDEVLGRLADIQRPVRAVKLPLPPFAARYRQTVRTESSVISYEPGDEFKFTPNPGAQVGFFEDISTRWCGCAGGWRSGKSTAAARKLILLHVLNAFDADGQPTGVRGLMCCLSYSLAKSTNIPQLLSAAGDFNLAVLVCGDPLNMRLVFPDLGTLGNQSQILVRSAEVPRAIAGFEVGHIWGDEVARWYRNVERPEEDALIQCDGRLSDRRARHIQFNLTSTQEGDDTSFYALFNAVSASQRLYVISTRENAHRLEPNYVESKRAILTPELFAQYIEGKAVSTRGATMYYALHEANLVSPIAPDQSKILCATFDFNVNPGSYCEVCMFDPGTRSIWVMKEHFAPGGGARQIAETVATWINEELVAKLPKIAPTTWPFPGVLNLFGDASGGQRNLADARLTAWSEITETLRVAGIPFTDEHVPLSNPRVGDRVSAMNCGLRSMSGSVRIRIAAETCTRLVADLQRMRWDGGREDKSDQERSHPSSALGYMAYQVLPMR